MDTPTKISLASLTLVIVGLLLTHFRTQGAVELIERVTKLETKVELFWTAVEGSMATILHRPTHVELDELLEKRERMEPLTEDESRKLERMLQEIVEDKNQVAGFRAAAAHMLAARKARHAT